MPRPATSNRADTRWTVRLIPFFCAAAIGYATYLTVAHLCVNYLLREKKKTTIAVVLLVLYFVFFTLALATYLRTFLTIQFETGFVPLSPQREALDRERERIKKRGGDLEALPWAPPDMNPDSPGLELFYSKDVFVCERDGRPKWCSECRTWKPDRAHHSSDLDRCVRKMDHLCPWVGGVVGENSFNFFVQFTFYCASVCAVCLAASGYSLHLKMQDGESLDARIVVGIALAGLFCLFTSAMTMTSARFVFTNITNIDLVKKHQVFRLAVRVCYAIRPTDRFQIIDYPLSPVVSSSTTFSRGQLDGVYRSRTPSPGPGVWSRDEQARRRFAILTTEPGENPWDLGYWGNFKSVMGNTVFEWLLPIRHSPCCNHDNMVSDYEYGPLIEVLKRRYGITDCCGSAKEGFEMTSS